MLRAIDNFHKTHPTTALELNVTRHPYSFIGDSRGEDAGGGLKGASDGQLSTWHDALLGYMGGNPAAREQAELGMLAQGKAAGITFDYGVKAQWQPVDSQRLLLWAGRFGLQEEFMSALNKRHFEQRQSASERQTLLAAAAEVGLDTAAASAFLDSRELEADVWRSYGETIRTKRIHSIPLFAFNVPAIDAAGGPFRAPGTHEAYVVRGSMDTEYFTELLELIARDVAAGTRNFDARALRLGRHDEWWTSGGSGVCTAGGDGVCAR